MSFIESLQQDDKPLYVREYLITLRDKYKVCYEEAFDFANLEMNEDSDMVNMYQQVAQRYMAHYQAFDFCLKNWDQYVKEST
jgi:hypothetical protein